MSFLTSDWEGKIFVSGWMDGGAQPIPVTAPATGEQLATVGCATPENVAQAAAHAAAAQGNWSSLPPSERAAIMRQGRLALGGARR